MSGGRYNFIQHCDAVDFLDVSTDEFVHMAEALKEDYGSEGVAAGEATLRLHARLTAARQQMSNLITSLDNDIRSLRQVWRQVDYHATSDVSREQVIEELVKYNATAALRDAVKPEDEASS